MKRILFLCAGILAVLSLCFADGYRQRQRAVETVAAQTPAADTKIRVLLKTAGFQSEYHEQVTVASANGFTVRSQGENKEKETRVPAGEEQTYTPDAQAFADADVLRLTAKDGSFFIRGLQRERKSEVYEGELELRRTDSGILLINELPLESYLYGVVPSEMPSSYPAEALKAQAVCARTYAKKRIQQESASEFFADVDDSVSYQVYNNQDRAASTDAAVNDTAGMVLASADGLIDALYYSTSCGLDRNLDLSEEAAVRAFLSPDSAEASLSCEAQEAWYRWQTDIFLEDLQDVSELRVQERLKSGIVNQLLATYANGTQRLLEGEYAIRDFLADASPVITLQDGVQIGQPDLIPSAVFVMQPLYEEERLYGYHLLGGGYGHGNGMSQNGAKHLAEEGAAYPEILRTYYKDAALTAG